MVPQHNWTKGRVCSVCAVFVLLFLLACGGGSSSSEGSGTEGTSIPKATHTTGLGVKVYIPASIYENGLYLINTVLTNSVDIDITLLGWIDTRVIEWVDSHPEMNPDILLQVAQSHTVVIHDHWGFPCSGSPSGLCNGSFKSDVIHASIYIKYESVEPPIGDYIPPHTIMTSEELAEWSKNNYWITGDKAGKYYFGTIPGDSTGISRGLLVVGHELNHAIGIDHD
jgi:hypothetical protein